MQLRVQNERRDQIEQDETKLRTTQFAHEGHVRHALDRAAFLEQQVADLRNAYRQPEHRYERKPASAASRDTQEYCMYGKDDGDDYEGGDDDDDDHYDYEWTEPEYAHHRPKSTPKMFTGTQTQTRTAPASASTGAREPPRDDGGRPPRRPDSSGGGASMGGGGANANPPGRRSGSGRNQGNGGPGGGPGGDDDDDADDRVPAPRHRHYEGSATNGYIRQEADKVEITCLPRSSFDVDSWFTTVYDAVMACSNTPDEAYAWVLDVWQDDATFTSLADSGPRFMSLDSKLRAALTKYITGDVANKHRELADEITKATDRAQHRKIPLRGRQILYIIRTFYQIDSEKRIQYSMHNLMSIEYPGDAQMSKFLRSWDHMLSNMQDNLRCLDEKFLEELLLGGIRKSERLKNYLDYYDRCLLDHLGRCYKYLHNTLGKVVIEDRQRKHKESLLSDVHAGRKKTQPVAAVTPTPNARTGGENATRSGTGGGRQRRREPGDSASDHGGSESGGENSTNFRALERKDRCCIRNLWGKCDLEWTDALGCSFGPHTKVCPEPLTKLRLYENMLAEHGPPTLAPADKGKGKGKGKGKDKGKGKGKGKPPAPAVAAEAAAAPQP